MNSERRQFIFHWTGFEGNRNSHAISLLASSLNVCQDFMKAVLFNFSYTFSSDSDQSTSQYIYIYRRFNAIVSQLKMHYFSEGAFESLISSQLLKKEKYI